MLDADVRGCVRVRVSDNCHESRQPYNGNSATGREERPAADGERCSVDRRFGVHRVRPVESLRWTEILSLPEVSVGRKGGKKSDCYYFFYFIVFFLSIGDNVKKISLIIRLLFHEMFSFHVL